MQVVRGRTRLVRGLHDLVAVDIVFHEIGCRDLFHEHSVGFDEKMIRFARHAHGNVVVSHADEHEMRDQPVRGRQLATQLPFILAYALAQKRCFYGRRCTAAGHCRSSVERVNFTMFIGAADATHQ